MSDLWLTIRSLAVTPSQEHFRPAADGSEDGDEFAAEVSDTPPSARETLPPIAGMSCIVGYEKPNGDRSERQLSCQRLDDHGGIIYLWAYCHSRARVQQFRIDRIIHVVDPITGEQLASVTDYFEQFAVDRTHRSQPGWGLSVRAKSDFIALLNALVFVARCDRKFHPLEREALEQIVCSFWLRMEHPDEPDCKSILAHIDRLAPDAETFWISMHRCANSPKLLSMLKAAARAVIEADGEIAPEEFYWGSRIDEFAREMSIAS